MAELCQKTIFDLLGKKFFIPSYQRGYRWRKEHIEALLDHIWEFAKDHKNPSSFYCLQPIVVTQKETQYEVIDGQQRLTTIYLVLKYFMEKHLKTNSLRDHYINDIFELSYQTRSKSTTFLQDISLNNVENDGNVDFYHMQEAYKTIDAWICKKLQVRQDKESFLGALLGRKDDSKSVQVIWYEFPVDNSSTSAYDLFSRLNIGKISLSNAELIKALFLKSWSSEDDKYFKLRQIKIASEWDYIESRLQDEGFWYFICNSNYTYINRIEYIFDIMENHLDHSKDRVARYTFNEFYKKINKEEIKDKKEVIDHIWQDVKNIFYLFDFWYRDNELYNLIGFLVTTNSENIKELLSKCEKNSKDDFKKILKESIKTKMGEIEIDALKYNLDKDKDNIRFVLLLHNIITVINSNNYHLKFPFDLYKKDSWDIEHISSQTDKADVAENEREGWIKTFFDFYSYIPNSKFKPRVLEFMDDSPDHKIIVKKPISKELFDNLFEDIWLSLSKEGRNQFTEILNKDSIGNLTLLDSATNRSYKNIWFPFKRQRVLNNDAKGKFVPMATKNVFSKIYSSPLSNAVEWNDSDTKSYQENIKKTIHEYLEAEGE